MHVLGTWGRPGGRGGRHEFLEGLGSSVASHTTAKLASPMLCNVPVTSPGKCWVSHKCNGARYKEVEVHVTTHSGRTEGHSVIHHSIDEPV